MHLFSKNPSFLVGCLSLNIVSFSFSLTVFCLPKNISYVFLFRFRARFSSSLLMVD